MVAEAIPGLLEEPSATWLDSAREPLSTSNDGINISTSGDSSTAVAAITFSSVLTSQSSQYTCIGSVMSIGRNFTVEESYMLNVLCKLSGRYNL